MESLNNFLLSGIVIWCLCISTIIAVYSIDTLEDPFSKRAQRRSFLQSFCTKRCNMGKGGNLCKCNGFHFAGKRTAYAPSKSDIERESDIFRLLEDIDDLPNDFEESLTNLQTSTNNFGRLFTDDFRDRYKER